MNKLLTAVLAGVLAAPLLAQTAQQPTHPEPGTTATTDTSGSPSGASASSATTEMPDAQMLTMTVHEAWLASGRNEDKFFDVVKRMAEMSASKRGLTLPETPEAGQRAGALIKAQAKKDPDQLLYAVVDNAVRMTATKK